MIVATPPIVPPFLGGLADDTLVPVSFDEAMIRGSPLAVNREILEIDESMWIGKLLARGLAGFFQEEQGFGAIMSALERVYSASRTSGGTKDAVQKALEELCAKGILDRQQKANQWVYRESTEFKERVRKA